MASQGDGNLGRLALLLAIDWLVVDCSGEECGVGDGEESEGVLAISCACESGVASSLGGVGVGVRCFGGGRGFLPELRRFSVGDCGSESVASDAVGLDEPKSGREALPRLPPSFGEASRSLLVLAGGVMNARDEEPRELLERLSVDWLPLGLKSGDGCCGW